MFLYLQMNEDLQARLEAAEKGALVAQSKSSQLTEAENKVSSPSQHHATQHVQDMEQAISCIKAFRRLCSAVHMCQPYSEPICGCGIALAAGLH